LLTLCVVILYATTLQSPPKKDTSIALTSHYMDIKIFNILPPYIKIYLIILGNFKFVSNNSYTYILFTLLKNIFNVNQSQADVPLNIFNKTIYLIYNLNNLCLLSLSLTKKNLNFCYLNVIHMCIIAICNHFAAICLSSVSDLFLRV